MASEPKCPDCGVKGTRNIVTLPSEQKAPGGMARFEIAFCAECGHIYGVYPNYMIQT